MEKLDNSDSGDYELPVMDFLDDLERDELFHSLLSGELIAVRVAEMELSDFHPDQHLWDMEGPLRKYTAAYEQVTPEMFETAKSRACDLAIKRKIEYMQEGTRFLHDWRPEVQKALAYLKKDITDYLSIEELDQLPGNNYPWEGLASALGPMEQFKKTIRRTLGIYSPL